MTPWHDKWSYWITKRKKVIRQHQSPPIWCEYVILSDYLTTEMYFLIKATQIAKFMGPWGQYGAKWAPCWPGGPCYQGCVYILQIIVMTMHYLQGVRQSNKMAAWDGWLLIKPWSTIKCVYVAHVHNFPLQGNCFYSIHRKQYMYLHEIKT